MKIQSVLTADPGPLVRGTREAREACSRCRETGAFILPDDVANGVREWIRDTDNAARDSRPKSFRPLDGMQTK